MTEGTATITAAIKRPEPGIDTLLEGYTSQAPEEARRLEVAEGGYDYNPLIAKLEEVLDHPNQFVARRKITDHIPDVLTPAEINAFLQHTRKLEQKEQYIERTGEFVSRLIQNSYARGHNGFYLDLTDLGELDNIGFRLEGTYERPINVNIKGRTGKNCANLSDNVIFTVEHAGNYFGNESRNSTFNIGTIDAYIGFKTSNSKFKTANQETLKKLHTHVHEGNQVIFIDENGKEQIKRGYEELRPFLRRPNW